VFGAAIFVASVLPNVYVSSATLLVEPQTISEDLLGRSEGGFDLTHRLNLMASEILSRSRLSRIIDDLGLYPEESEEMTREEVIELMRSHIRVEPVIPELEVEDSRDQQIDTFRIEYRAGAPRVAADVANRLARDFRDEHIKNRTEVSGETSEFVEAELQRLAGRIQRIEELIGAVKTENSGRLPEDLVYNQQLQQRAYEDLRTAEREVALAESDAAFYRQQGLSGLTPWGSTDSSPEQKLRLLELRIAEYRSLGFTDKHPDIIATEREVLEIRESIESDQAEASEEDGATSLAQQNAKGEEQRAVARAEAARAEVARLEQQIQEVNERLAATPRVAERLNALEREYEHLHASFQDFSNKRLDASVAANIERQVKGERFRVLESAVAKPTPASPNRPLILVLGLMLGPALGLGLGLMLEATDSSFYAPRRLQETFQLPVLAAIPQILLEQDRKLQRRKRLRTAALASVLGILVLSGSGVGYVVVNGVPASIEELTAGDAEEAAVEPAAEEDGG
jgi:polysaccharide chain length determinant protein (PEP-CTERM system associated)